MTAVGRSRSRDRKHSTTRPNGSRERSRSSTPCWCCRGTSATRCSTSSSLGAAIRNAAARRRGTSDDRAEGRPRRRGRHRAVLRPGVRGDHRSPDHRGGGRAATGGERAGRGGTGNGLPVAPGAARGLRRRRGARVHARRRRIPRSCCRASSTAATCCARSRWRSTSRAPGRWSTAAEAAGVVFTMAAKFRFVKDVIRARQIVASGILGELIVVENLFASRVDMTRRWNSDPAISGRRRAHRQRHAFGGRRPLLPRSGRRGHGGRGQADPATSTVEDTATMLLRTADGVLGTVDLSWSVEKATDAYLTLYGSQGTISVGWQGARYRQISSPEWVEFGDGYDKVSCMVSQVENFCAAIRGEEPLADHRRRRDRFGRGDRGGVRVARARATGSRYGTSGAATPRRVSRWHDASAIRGAHPSDRGDRRRCGDRCRHRDLVGCPHPRSGDARRRRLHRRRAHAHRLRRADRRPGEAQRVRVRLHGGHDRDRRDDRSAGRCSRTTATRGRPRRISRRSRRRSRTSTRCPPSWPKARRSVRAA